MSSVLFGAFQLLVAALTQTDRHVILAQSYRLDETGGTGRGETRRRPA
jgi:hypothetical protein